MKYVTSPLFRIFLGVLVLLLVAFPTTAIALNEEELEAIQTNTEWMVPDDSQFAELGVEEQAGQGGNPTTPGGGSGDAAANQEVARQMLASYGWDDQEQFDCLVSLWTEESGWLTTADNPNSSAYGIPQALLSTHEDNINTNYPGYYEGTVENPTGGDAAVQIRWGLDYIRGRDDYGSPCAAWDLWQRRSPHWY